MSPVNVDKPSLSPQFHFRSRTGRGNVLKLRVNFLPEIITLYKEVRNLKSLGFRVPLAIVNKAHQANQLYPFAISLIESVRTYERTLDKVSDGQIIRPSVETQLSHLFIHTPLNLKSPTRKLASITLFTRF